MTKKRFCSCPGCICPCENCVCIPICMHRTIAELKLRCVLLDRYFSRPHFKFKKIEMRRILKPTSPHWEIGYEI